MGRLQALTLRLKLITQAHNAKIRIWKYAKAISDRSGLEFPYKEMVREWNGSFVHVSEFEPKQPQLEPKPMNGDAISLRNVRPPRIESAVPYLLPTDAFETYSSGSRIINVTAPGHGLTNGTTYRFRGVPLAILAPVMPSKFCGFAN